VPASGASQIRKKTSASQGRVYQPTSLNLGVRKKETERIERENHAFAKRLFDRQAVVNKRNLDKDYMQHLKYRRQIQKMPTGMKAQRGQVNQNQRTQTRGGAATDNYPQPPSHYLAS